MIIDKGNYIKINKPEWFKDINFLNCLKEKEWTWYEGIVDEYVDTILYYETLENIEHLPKYIAEEIENICKSENLKTCLIWIQNILD